MFRSSISGSCTTVQSTTDKKFNFEYPALTKIHGEPNHLTIINMMKELKANTQRQCSEIGGWHYSYLPLVIPKADLLTLPITIVVVLPVAPAPFTVVSGTTSIQSMIQKSQWETETKAYLEYVQMHLILKNKYLKRLIWDNSRLFVIQSQIRSHNRHRTLFLSYNQDLAKSTSCN